MTTWVLAPDEFTIDRQFGRFPQGQTFSLADGSGSAPATPGTAPLIGLYEVTPTDKPPETDDPDRKHADYIRSVTNTGTAGEFVEVWTFSQERADERIAQAIADAESLWARRQIRKMKQWNRDHIDAEGNIIPATRRNLTISERRANRALIRVLQDVFGEDDGQPDGESDPA